MAYEDDIQKVKSIFGDVGGLLDTGISIFGRAKETLYPSWSQSPPAPSPTPEPIAAQPIVVGGVPLSFDNPLVIVAIVAIGYLMLAKK